MSTNKRGPNFTISPIPAFGGHPLLWPSIIEARAQCTSKNVMVIFAAGPRLWTPASYTTAFMQLPNLLLSQKFAYATHP